MTKQSFRIRDSDGQYLGQDKDIIDKTAYEFLEEYKTSNLGEIVVPEDPDEFLADFGGIPHPYKKNEDGMPIMISKWAWYQKESWGDFNSLQVSSNKVGKTTSHMMNTFQSRLFKRHAGFDALLVAQNQKMANDHLLHLKRLVRSSPKYWQFVIERPEHELFKEEKSKLETMYVRNRWDNLRPSRIIALGGSEASAYSWKNVDWIHMSDVTQLTSTNQKLFFGALFSRLANTNGIAKIETIPGAREGEVYRIYREIHNIKDKSEEDLAEDDYDIASTFKYVQVTIDDAIAEGLVQEDYKKKMQALLDPNTFAQLFMAEWVEVENQWYNEEWIKTGDYGAD